MVYGAVESGPDDIQWARLSSQHTFDRLFARGQAHVQGQ